MTGCLLESLNKRLHPGCALLQLSSHLLTSSTKSGHHQLLLLAENLHLLLCQAALLAQVVNDSRHKLATSLKHGAVHVVEEAKDGEVKNKGGVLLNLKFLLQRLFVAK